MDRMLSMLGVCEIRVWPAALAAAHAVVSSCAQGDKGVDAFPPTFTQYSAAKNALGRDFTSVFPSVALLLCVDSMHCLLLLSADWADVCASNSWFKNLQPFDTIRTPPCAQQC